MSSYVVSDANLTSIADAIRSKGGTSAALSFPAEFVSAISAISTGGGGVPACFDALAFEEFTLSSDVTTRSDINISHSLGVVPNHIFLWRKTQTEPSTSSSYWLFIQYTKLTNKLLLGTTDNSNYSVQNANGYAKSALDVLSFKSGNERNMNYGIHGITNVRFVLGIMGGNDPIPAGDYWLMTAKFKDIYLQENGAAS